MNYKSLLNTLFTSLLQSADPQRLVREQLHWAPRKNLLTINGTIEIPIQPGQKIYAIGAGKAAATMAAGLEKVFKHRLESGMVIVPPDTRQVPERIQTLPGNHPLPGKESLSSARKLLSFIETLPENSVVINLFSGGASALFCSPVVNLKPEEIRQVFEQLIASGAVIQEINTVRKTLSNIKGGRLLKKLKQHHLVDLLISDIPDDDLRFIGSGPTIPQEISFLKAEHVLQTYHLWKSIPEPVRKYLRNGIEKEKSAGRPVYTQEIGRHHHHILMSAKKLAQKAGGLLTEHGFDVHLDETPWSGPAEDFEQHIHQAVTSALSAASRPAALLFFGECTVQVTGNGLGGRNQELALRMARRLSSVSERILFMSAGTDGIDGPTDAAGAIVDQNTWPEAKRLGLNPEEYLNNNDSYHFFARAGGHITTGPTGNNLMDIQIVLIPG